MNLKLTTHQQELAAEHIRLTTELIKRNIGRSTLTYDEIYDASVEAFIRTVIDFKPSLGFKFSTLFFVAGDRSIKNKLRFNNAKKRTGTNISIYDPVQTKNGDAVQITDMLYHHDHYSFFDQEEMSSTFENSGLKETEKKCIYLYYYRRMSQGEIAKKLGFSQNHVSRLMKNGIAKMRGTLSGNKE